MTADKKSDTKRTHSVELIIADLFSVFMAGLLAYIFNQSASQFLLNNGSVLIETAIVTSLYFIAFLVVRPYKSFSRPVNSHDIAYILCAVIIGGILSALFISFCKMVFDYHDIILQAVLTLIAMVLLRAAVRSHYRHYSRRSDINGSYGLSEMALLNMELSSLLSRTPIEIDYQNIRQSIQGKTVLVTGAAGSIGSELVKILAAYRPAKLIVLDQAETPLHLLGLELRRNFPELNSEIVLGDILDRQLTQHVFDRFNPQIVFHAAAYKHVSMMEANPCECIVNNVEGTVNIALLAHRHDCEKFILISSDKAVNPTGVMGCSKRICEIFCQSLSPKSECSFITTRFGNVLGSNGSVVPIFREQIRRGGPVTVTHPDVIRFFMLVNEACELVLEAAAAGKGGEIFVFDMGLPVRIDDLARKMIRISGRKDVRIEYIGLQKGEKLFEEVLNDDEKVVSTPFDRLKIAKVRQYDFDCVNGTIWSLIEAAKEGDRYRVLRLMHDIVPEFKKHHELLVLKKEIG
ncbi:MAG: polysaccharide biosynthesis protein [Paramuribaculum sp.]|nr:polysaccharide biosynthesis protein [Paramuribaculum sp.]